jgi:hypothetical protein
VGPAYCQVTAIRRLLRTPITAMGTNTVTPLPETITQRQHVAVT